MVKIGLIGLVDIGFQLWGQIFIKMKWDLFKNSQPQPVPKIMNSNGFLMHNENVRSKAFVILYRYYIFVR